MPDQWIPPVPAWSADLGDRSSLAIAYYGVQHHTGDSRDSEASFALLRHGPDAPDYIERGRFNDLAGFVNEVFVCYWRNTDGHALPIRARLPAGSPTMLSCPATLACGLKPSAFR